MNLILMKKKYPPAIIKVEERKRYIDALMEADKGNLTSFIKLGCLRQQLLFFVNFEIPKHKFRK